MRLLAADENFNGNIARGLLRRQPALDLVRLLASFPPDSQSELDTLLAGIGRDQAGIVSHDHFLYVVRPVPERRLTTDAKSRCQNHVSLGGQVEARRARVGLRSSPNAYEDTL